MIDANRLSPQWSGVFSLLFAAALLVVGVGLFFSALGLRAGLSEFSTITTGMVMSAYFAGFVVGTWLCPLLVRRVGHIRTFSVLASIASTTAIVHAMWTNPWLWGALRLMTGICLVGLYMVLESWLNVIAPNAARGRIFAAYMAVTLIAMGVGQFLVTIGDVMEFVQLGLVSILLSLALVPVAFTRTREPKPVEAPKVSLTRLYVLSPLGVIAALSSGLLNGALYGMGAVFGQRLGLTEAGVAAFMGATIFGGALLQWPVGHFSDRHDRRQVLTYVCLGGAILAAAAYVVSGYSTSALIVCAFFYGGMVFTVYGLSVALVNDKLAQDEVLEAASTLLLVHGVGAMIGPTAAGMLMSLFGPGSLLIYFILVLVASVMFGLRELRATEIMPEQQSYVPIGTSTQVMLEMDPRTADPPAPEA
jgi:MFS family permease